MPWASIEAGDDINVFGAQGVKQGAIVEDAKRSGIAARPARE